MSDEIKIWTFCKQTGAAIDLYVLFQVELNEHPHWLTNKIDARNLILKDAIGENRFSVRSFDNNNSFEMNVRFNAGDMPWMGEEKKLKFFKSAPEGVSFGFETCRINARVLWESLVHDYSFNIPNPESKSAFIVSTQR